MRKAKKKPAHFVGGKIPWTLYARTEKKLRDNRLTWKMLIIRACKQFLIDTKDDVKMKDFAP